MNTRIIAVVTAALAAALSGVLVSSSAASGGGVPECTNADLHASYRSLDAATSHTYGRIVLTNVSGHACVTGGYGGLSYVGDGDGTQIGAAADRQTATVSFYVLLPGQRVHSRVTETSYAPFPRSKCQPRHVDGFRVYVPDAHLSQYVPHPTTGCANAEVHLLAHKPYRR